MNLLWTILVVGSILLFIIQDPNLLLTTATTSIYDSLKMCFTLAGIYIFWLGIIQIMQDSGLADKLSKILTPIIFILFGNIDKDASRLIAINISANLLGLGNASLPAGLKAMQKLDNKKEKASQQMIMLFALNCCSIQLLPSTIILMRSEGGSSSSSDIILPIILVSVVCFMLSIFLVKLLFRENKK